MAIFDRLKEGMQKTRKNLAEKFDRLTASFRKVDEEFFDELEQMLVEADTGIKAAIEIMDALKKKSKELKITNPAEIKSLLKTEITNLLQSDGKGLDISSKPSVILVVGVNGTGKTTTIGKIASLLVKSGKTVIIAAADTFRAAAAEQLEIWSERSGASIIRQSGGSDPAAVVYDSLQAAKARDADVLICDTAGRLHTKKNLMDELGKISRVINREIPGSLKEILLVLDASTGQNAVVQARIFKECVGVTGIVLTKLDGTAKGGIIIAIKAETGIPVKYIGIGEKIDDMQEFDAAVFTETLFE